MADYKPGFYDSKPAGPGRISDWGGGMALRSRIVNMHKRIRKGEADKAYALARDAAHVIHAAIRKGDEQTLKYAAPKELDNRRKS